MKTGLEESFIFMVCNAVSVGKIDGRSQYSYGFHGLVDLCIEIE